MAISPSKKSAKTDRNDPAVSWVQMLARWNMEIASLYGKRMQEYCLLPVNLMRCASPDDLARAQEEFSQTLLSDYRDAAEKLARAIGAGAAEGGSGYAAALLRAQEDARDILDQAKAQAQRIVEEAEARSAGPMTAGAETKAA